MEIIRRDPDKGYLDTSLWVPKRLVNVDGVKSALSIPYTKNGQPEYLLLWRETPGHIVVPREFWDLNQLDCPVIDCRPQSFPRVDIRSKIVLDAKSPEKTVQRDALAAALEARGGVLNLACGVGKTVISLELIARLGMPALVIVDNTTLLKQWESSIEMHLDVPGGIGHIDSGRFDWKKSIVMATYMTLANHSMDMPEEVRRWFGTIVWDECFPAGTFVDGRPIESIRVGDYVNSFNHASSTVEKRQVTRTFRKRPHFPIKVIIQDGNDIACTADHPFWTRRGYIAAKNLTSEDVVMSFRSGSYRSAKVVGIRPIYPMPYTLEYKEFPDGFSYNIEVEGNNNYFVDGILVHNCHHVGAPVFCRSVDLFYGRRYGLSATKIREDGLHIVYDMHIGKTLYKYLMQDIKPTVYFKWTGLTLDVDDPKTRAMTHDLRGELHLGKLASYFGQWRTRLDLVIKEIREARAKDRRILVLSNSIAELVNLLSLWNGSDKLYTDIPYPTPQDVGGGTDGFLLAANRVVKLQQKLGITNTELKTPGLLPHRKQQIEMIQVDVRRQLEAHRIAKAQASEFEKRQKRFIKEINDQSSDAGLMIQHVKADRRDAIVKTKHVVFSIMKYGREGLDSPMLDTVIMCEPISSRNVLQQVMGRALRKKEGKKHPIILFLEDDVGPIIGQCRKLKRYLTDWPVDEGGPLDFELLNHPRSGSNAWKPLQRSITTRC